jgi:trimeric autotransporter adhesin
VNFVRKYIAVIICVLLPISEAGAQIITTVAGNGTTGYSGDGGLATAAQLYLPAAITFDALGNFFIADEYNNVVRKVNAAGIITTIAGNGYGAGTGIGGYSGDGGPATAAEMYDVTDVVCDIFGNLFIADSKNNVIRKVNSLGVISTVAGCGILGYSGDGGSATLAKLNGPTSVAVDNSGNLYISEQGGEVIRKVNTGGIIGTIAGTGVIGYSGDGGPATSAAFAYPTTLVGDKHGNLFISDQDNNCIRKISSSGIISTVAGTGVAGYNGDGGPATAALLNNTGGVAIDTFGNLFISDNLNHVIRKVNTAGIISTVAGIGSPGYSGDGGLATLCKLRAPWGVRVDFQGNLFIADYGNNVIRKVPMPDPEKVDKACKGIVEIYPNPAADRLSVLNAKETELVIYDIVGREVYRKHLVSDKEQLNISSLLSGVYIVQLSDQNGGKRDFRVVKE